MNIITNSPQETKNLGLKLAKKCHGGDLLALYGDLGGGKTCFTQGFARGLGLTGRLASPSFVLMAVHQLPTKAPAGTFCHVDAYRLKNPSEILEVGLPDYLGNQKAVIVIEWADKIKRIIAPYITRELFFQHQGPTTRKITVTKKR